MFISKDMVKQMRWHKDGRKDDGNILGHSADGIEWKEFDKEHEWFVCDSCNVRLGLASDGFNQFGNISTSYCIWPIVLTSYNLPLWMCMKAPPLILSLLSISSQHPETTLMYICGHWLMICLNYGINV